MVQKKLKKRKLYFGICFLWKFLIGYVSSSVHKRHEWHVLQYIYKYFYTLRALFWGTSCEWERIKGPLHSLLTPLRQFLR